MGAKPTMATQLAVTRCTNPDCACGNVYVELLDHVGKVFAVASFGAEEVDGVVAAMIEARDELRARTDRLAGQGDPDAIAAQARRRPVQ